MKKLLLCSFFILALCLTGCNNNTHQNDTTNDVTGNDKNTNIQDQNEEETGTVVYDTPDFSKSAGFKVALDDSLKDVKYDSIFLTNNSVAQLDLEFPDQTIGTLLVDSNESTYLYDPSDAVFIDDIKVSIEVGADGIIVYEWQKDNSTFVYHSKVDLKNSDILKNLVNGITIELTEER